MAFMQYIAWNKYVWLDDPLRKLHLSIEHEIFQQSYKQHSFPGKSGPKIVESGANFACA